MQEAVVSELKRKQRQIKEKKVLNRDEVYHGALEDILLGKNTSRNLILHEFRCSIGVTSNGL